MSDFLAYAKPQSENMVYSNFQEEIEYVKNILIPYAKIKQCLINLFKNGIESMKENGGTLYIDVIGQNHKVIITIRDSGIGMTKAEILQLGKPYYSTKKEAC